MNQYQNSMYQNPQQSAQTPMYQQHTMYDPTQHVKQIHDLCHKHQLELMQLQTSDGQIYDGIIERVDQEGVTVLMPCGDEQQDEWNRQFGWYGGFGPGYGYGFGYPRRFRRFRRRRFPFFTLSGLWMPFFY